MANGPYKPKSEKNKLAGFASSILVDFVSLLIPDWLIFWIMDFLDLYWSIRHRKWVSRRRRTRQSYFFWFWFIGTICHEYNNTSHNVSDVSKKPRFFSFDLSVKIHIQVDDFQFLVIAYMDVDMKKVETADTEMTFIWEYSKWNRSRTRTWTHVLTNGGQPHPPNSPICPMSILCSNFSDRSVRCLSAVWILSGYSVRCLSVRILSVSILSDVFLSGFCLSRFCLLSRICPKFLKKRCPLSVCPAGQGRDRVVWIFGVLVGRRLLY